MKRLAASFALLCTVIAALAGCASADLPQLVNGATSAQARPASTTPASLGSLFPAAAGMTNGYRPLFEDRRARNVGDTLTVMLNERTSANRRSNASAQRSASAGIGLNSANKIPLASSLVGLGVDGNAALKSEGKGTASAANDFSGTITVTVVDVMPNGNLAVGGEKRLAVSAEEEIIRFAGVVNPADLVNNTVYSSQVADARIEYRGRGVSDDAQSPGWLSRLLMKVSPF